MSIGAAFVAFWTFPALMGLSLAGIFLVFTGASIASVFFISAGTFAAMSPYGYKSGAISRGSVPFCSSDLWVP
jgi:FtsH-binding integral membrane protein